MFGSFQFHFVFVARLFHSYCGIDTLRAVYWCSIERIFAKQPAVVWAYIGMSTFERKCSKVVKIFKYTTIVWFSVVFGMFYFALDPPISICKFCFYVTFSAWLPCSNNRRGLQMVLLRKLKTKQTYSPNRGLTI